MKTKKLTLTAAAGELDGSRIIRRKVSTNDLNLNSVQKLGRKLAREIKAAGGAEILASLQNN